MKFIFFCLNYKKKLFYFQIRIEVSLGNPFVMMFNKTVDVCLFLEKKINDPLVNIFFKELTTIFKLTKCPLPKVSKTILILKLIEIK